jgi:hypothetical protein
VTAADRIVRELAAVTGFPPRREGRGWKARCPAHNDRNPSLSVTETETRAKVHCFAGCDDTAVLDALGLTVRELYNEPKTSYRYDDGRVVTRAVRPDNAKDFRQSVGRSRSGRARASPTSGAGTRRAVRPASRPEPSRRSCRSARSTC